MKRFFLSLNYKIILDVTAAIGALIFIAESLAQTPPQLLLTWSAENYAPAGFGGKVLPIKGSVVDVALEAIEKNRPMDLDGKKIKWTLDDGAPISGVGLKHFSFTANASAGGEHVLRVSFPSASGELFKQVRIPTAGPELAFIKRRVGETSYSFRALPYFFNIKDAYRELEFSWNVNGRLLAGADAEPDRLTLELGAPRGSKIDVVVAVKNSGRPLELVKDGFAFIH